MRECGPKGATVVEVSMATSRSVTCARSRSLDMSWAVDVGAVSDDVEVLERVEAALKLRSKPPKGVYFSGRIEISGITSAHGLLVRRARAFGLGVARPRHRPRRRAGMAGAHRLADRGSALIRGERRRDRGDAEDPPEREREP